MQACSFILSVQAGNCHLKYAMYRVSTSNGNIPVISKSAVAAVKA